MLAGVGTTGGVEAAPGVDKRGVPVGVTMPVGRPVMKSVGDGNEHVDTVRLPRAPQAGRRDPGGSCPAQAVGGGVTFDTTIGKGIEPT